MQSKVEEVLLCSIPSQRVYPVSFQAPLPWPILHWPAPLLVIHMRSQAIRLPGSARSGSFCIVHCLHHRRNPTFLVSSVPPAAAAGTWDGSWGWTPLAKNLAFLRHLRILVRCTSSQELAWQEHLHRASAQKQGLLGYSSYRSCTCSGNQDGELVAVCISIPSPMPRDLWYYSSYTSCTCSWLKLVW